MKARVEPYGLYDNTIFRAQHYLNLFYAKYALNKDVLVKKKKTNEIYNMVKTTTLGDFAKAFVGQNGKKWRRLEMNVNAKKS